MTQKIAKARIVGVAPLLVHNQQLADPQNEYTRRVKELTSRKKKTDADVEELNWAEWMGGLYLDDKGRPCIPGEVFDGCLRSGAKQIRQGKMMQCGVMTLGLPRIEHDGPADLEKLYANPRYRDCRGVVVSGRRIMRMRPCFPVWALNLQIQYHPSVVDAEQIERWLVDAGTLSGLCDFRPRYGRFTVESFTAG